MADALHRTTKQYLRSVNTPDYPVQDWIINPDLSAVGALPPKYWNITGDVVTPMIAGEQAAVDAAELAGAVTGERAELVARVDESLALDVRALLVTFNKRDNYLVNRIEELQAALDAVKASSGPADNIRNAIPASWLPTSTRQRPDLIQDYKDEINAGNAD